MCARRSLTVWIAFSLLTAVLAGLCFGSLAEHLLDTHDAETFRDNAAIGADFSYFFSANKEQPSGRPLAELLKWLAYLVWGNDPFWFHLLVVGFHAMAAVLLAAWAHQVGLSLSSAGAGSLLFLVNVAHFRAVHHISALDYPLALALALGALICCGRYFDRAQSRWSAGFIILLAAGTQAHLATTIVLPVCLYWGWSRRLSFHAHQRVALLAVCVQGLLTAYLLATASTDTSTWKALHTYGTDAASDLSLGFWHVLLWLAGRTVTTAHWVPLSLYRLAEWELFAGAAVFAVLLYGISRRGRAEGLFSCWTVLALLPFAVVNEEIVVNLPAGPSRYLYLATAGSSLLLAIGWRLASSLFGRWQGLLFGLGVVAVVSSSYRSLKGVETISLYTSARSYVARNDVATGIDRLQRALAADVDLIDLEDTYERLSFLLIGSGDDASAVLQAGLQRFPNSAKLTIYQQVIRSMSPDPLERSTAQARLAEVVGYAPGNPRLIAQAYQSAGDGQYQKLRLGDALAAYAHALEYDAERLSARINLGWTLITAGRPEEAIEQYRFVLSRGPHSIAQFNLALCHLASGAYARAGTAYEAAFGRHGVAEAERLGVPGHLALLISRGPHAAAAREIQRRYWPED